MIEIRKILSTALFLAVTVAACAGQSESEGSETPAKSAQELHDLREQEIARCMRSEGFDYTPVPYVVTRDVSLDFWLYLKDSDDLGYRGVFGALLPMVTNLEGSEEELDEPMTVAFEEALRGRVTVGHSYDDAGDHTHEEASDHSHDLNPDRGCLGEGVDAVSALAAERPGSEIVDFESSESLKKFEDFFASLVASGEFIEFSDRWTACMKSYGYDVQGPVQQPSQASFDFSDRTEELVASDDSLRSNIEQLSTEFGPLIDAEVFQQYLGALPQIGDVFKEELKMSQRDTKCRTAHIGEVEDVISSTKKSIYG